MRGEDGRVWVGGGRVVVVGGGECREGVGRGVVMTRTLQGGGIGGRSRLYEGGKEGGSEGGREGGREGGGTEGGRGKV